MNTKICQYLLIVFSSLLFSQIGATQGKDVDYLALTKLLVKDGQYTRAEKTLKKLTFKEADDKAIYKSLEGMIALSKRNYQQAIDSFHSALSYGLKELEVYIYLAEAQLQLQLYKQAKVSIENVDKESKIKLPYFLIKAEIFWKMNNKQEAWQQLKIASSLGLSKSLILKKKFYYLIEDSLYLTAYELATQLLVDPNSYNDVLAMASQLRIRGQRKLSLTLLQSLQVRKPGNELVALEMAQNYLEQNHKFSAALVLEKAAKHNNSLNYEASEFLRQVGKSYRSRFINLSILDESQRLKQKMALYLEDEDYHSLQYLIPDLQKNQLLEDEEIRYAIAYALFKVGSFEKSNNYLSSIKGDDLFIKSVELKKQMKKCNTEKWSCYETI